MIECIKNSRNTMKHAKQVGLKNPPNISINHEQTTSTRLNKYISESGVASRRGADRLIQEGKVLINGQVAEVGQTVAMGDLVSVDGTLINNNINRVYIALNKPVGITSTTDLEDPSNMIDYMNYPDAIFPIGRLDKDSHGLILLTNDGDVVNKILREENGHDKEYIVKVHKPFEDSFIEKMSQGVEIYNQKQHRNEITNPCKVYRINDRTFNITLNQGLNRQIRRMTKALGYRTVNLCRKRIINIQLGDLKQGEWRYLNETEIQELNDLLNKNNTPN